MYALSAQAEDEKILEQQNRFCTLLLSILSLESEFPSLNRPSNDRKSAQTDDLSPRKLDNSEKWSIFASITDCLSSYIFFCTTNIHIFSDNLLFSSVFFKFLKDHMPASCEWGLRMLYLLHSH